MSDRSHFDGEITIIPPLTWNKCRTTPGTDDAQVRIHEETTDSVLGQTRVLTGVAIVAKDFAYGPQLPGAIQAIIDAHPKHEFSGCIEEWVELGYRELPRRYVVQDRRVVVVQAVWPDEGQDLVEDARDVALACKNILNQMPVFVADFFEGDWENMPDWFTGEDNGNDVWVGES